MMTYRAVGSRCAIDLNSFKLSIIPEVALSLLESGGFRVVVVDLIELARSCIGKSHYRRGARLYEAPQILDCSSFIKWLYGQRGVWLPRRSIQQRELGEVVNEQEIVAGDVIFVSGWIDYFIDDPADGVGHVGIATDDATVIHAVSRKAGIIERPIEKFIGNGKFRGARRYIPKNKEVITLEIPIEREVETADDVKWILLQQLSRR